MTKLGELFEPALLAEMLEQGYIRRQEHPDLPLFILNYSEKAQYERVWNEATRQCRGLVIESGTDEVVARPFRKFFNHGENADVTAVLEPDEPVVVTDKMDGSLGILFWAAGDWHIATRGSFTSDQAAHATKVFRERYGYLQVQGGVTALFEIVYPENRIVLDYGATDDLILLGAVDIATGRSMSTEDAQSLLEWRGPVAETFDYGSLGEALAATPRPNREGLVVHGLTSDERIKLKQEDYVRLHRIVTGLSTRTVWEHLGEGKPLDELLEPLPEEFHPWVRQVADELHAHAAKVEENARRVYDEVLTELPPEWARKDFAMVAKVLPERGYLFLLLDGKCLDDNVWREIKPERATLPPGMAAHTEDTA